MNVRKFPKRYVALIRFMEVPELLRLSSFHPSDLKVAIPIINTYVIQFCIGFIIQWYSYYTIKYRYSRLCKPVTVWFHPITVSIRGWLILAWTPPRSLWRIFFTTHTHARDMSKGRQFWTQKNPSTVCFSGQTPAIALRYLSNATAYRYSVSAKPMQV